MPSDPATRYVLNGVTLLLAAGLAADRIAVNSVCPGWVRTDMGGPTAPRSVDEGANAVVWLTAEAP